MGLTGIISRFFRIIEIEACHKFNIIIMKFRKRLRKLLLLLLLFCTSIINAQVSKDPDTGLYFNSNGEPYTGTHLEYDEGGVLMRKLQLLDGQFYGENVVYFDNGSVREIQSYTAGLMDGTWTIYNASGVKTAQAGYMNGKKHGSWFIWNDQGILMFEMYYEDGERSGTWIKYAEDGKVFSSEEY